MTDEDFKTKIKTFSNEELLEQMDFMADGYYSDLVEVCLEELRYRLEANRWHYPSKGEYPPVGEFDATSHLVLVFWWNTDCNGKKAKVYGLDRWCEQHKEWDSYPQHPIAWMPLPEPPKEEA